MMLENIKNHALDAEASLIGHVLMKPEIMFSMYELDAKHFFSQPHAEIWQAMRDISDKKDPLSLFTVAAKIPSEKYQEAGGVNKYLAGCIAHAMWHLRPDDLREYLIELWNKRELEIACKQEDLDKVISAVKDFEKTRHRQPFVDNVKVTENIIESMKLNENPYSTGIIQIDEAMDGGLYPKKSYGIAARKKMGKTIMAATLSHNLNLQGVKHLFICGEMSPEEIQQRVLCRIMDRKSGAFRLDRERLSFQICEKLRDMPRNVIYRNAPGLVFDELKSMLDSAIELYGIKGFILDYWQLVGGKRKNQNTAEHLDEVAQWIADYTRKKGLFSIVFAQINQEGNTRGGEGIRLAFDQVYELKAPEDDPSRSCRWLEMRDTRYTAWINIGSDDSPRLHLNERGLFFEYM